MAADSKNTSIDEDSQGESTEQVPSNADSTNTLEDRSVLDKLRG